MRGRMTRRGGRTRRFTVRQGRCREPEGGENEARHPPLPFILPHETHYPTYPTYPLSNLSNLSTIQPISCHMKPLSLSNLSLTIPASVSARKVAKPRDSRQVHASPGSRALRGSCLRPRSVHSTPLHSTFSFHSRLPRTSLTPLRIPT